MPPKSRKSAPAKKPSAKKPATGRPYRKGGYPLKALVAALLLLGFLVVSLIFLSQVRRHLKPEVSAPPPAAESRGAGEGRRTEPEREAQAPHPEEAAPPATSEPEPAPRGEEPSRKPESPPLFPPLPPRPDGAPARLAIIMDDLGRDMATGRALVEIGVPVTFAILPDQPHSARLAEFAHRNGREVIIHLPMEPRGYPVANPGEEALFVDQPAEEVQRRMRDFIARVPHAVGGNNHMGSRFTESREGMRAALSVLKDDGLFFVDSFTSGKSVGFEEARQAGIPSTVRDVFLDNVQEVGAISAQLAKLVQIAHRRGEAVGICHPYPQTLEALRLAAPELDRMGIEVVPVSALLKR